MWVGSCVGEFYCWYDVFTVCGSWSKKERDVPSSRHLAYTKYLFSEFLTPSRRSHPHVEPLLAPPQIFGKKNRGLNCFWAFKECISPEDTSSLKPPFAFLFWQIPSVDFHYKVSMFVKKCPKASFPPCLTLTYPLFYSPLSPLLFPFLPS